MKNYLATGVVLFLFLCSCTYEKVTPRIACETPDVVSFSRDVQPVFDAHCATAGCHMGANPQGNLNLEASESYMQLWKSKSGYIDTLHPEFSVLYASMNSTSDPMPPGGKLDKCTLELVLKWIQQKAKNN